MPPRTDRELDALVAEKVVDIPRWLIHLDDSGPRVLRDPDTGRETLVRAVDRYSTDIGSAWSVVEAMRAKTAVFEGAWWPNAMFNARFTWQLNAQQRDEIDGVIFDAADDPARAICLAALRARGLEVPA